MQDPDRTQVSPFSSALNYWCWHAGGGGLEEMGVASPGARVVFRLSDLLQTGPELEVSTGRDVVTETSQVCVLVAVINTTTKAS